MNGSYHFFSLRKGLNKAAAVFCVGWICVGSVKGTASFGCLLSAIILGGVLSIADMLQLFKEKWQQTIAVVLMIMASWTAALLFENPGQSSLWVESQFFDYEALTALLAVLLFEYYDRKENLG
jgi:hypothetical protein